MNEHIIVNTLIPGDIVFDIGANTGEKANWLQRHGIKVVCVEPQPAMIKILEERFSGNTNVEIVGKALGSCIGELPMSICSENPVLSTLSDTWKKGRFSGRDWDTVVNVSVTTLDELIKVYGIPRYTKIDVEGFEMQVLSGLSRRIGVISFEFTSEFIKDAFEIMGLLIRLGYTKYNVSVGEDPRFSFKEWLSFYDLIPILSQNCQHQPNLWGDIYAN